MKIIRYLLFIILISGLIMPPSVFSQENGEGTTATSSTADSLRRVIDEKSVELQELQAEREKLEKTLEEINKSGNTLNKEIKLINYNINQLNLTIRSNKLILEKLELELDASNEEIDGIEDSVQLKKEAIVKLFVELQVKDRENILTIVLKNKSLTQSVAEVQSISLLSNSLINGIDELKNLRQELTEKIGDGQKKKRNKEVERANLLNRQYIVKDQKNEKERLLIQTKNQEKVYQQELQQLIKRQLEISEEVEKIESELRSKIDPNLLPLPRPGVLGMPILPAGAVSQNYGETKFARYGYRGKFHNGIDIAAPIGTPILAVENGVVEVTGDQDRYCRRGAYGKYIIIKHDNGLTTLYAHLSRIVAEKGAKVEKGSLIGYVGRTGYATGPHLHLTVYASLTFYMGTSRSCGPMPYGGHLNPLQYL